MTIDTGTDTLTPIGLGAIRPMDDTVNGVAYLQEVQIGAVKLLALLDHHGRLHSVHGGRSAGLGDGLAYELVRLARGVADWSETCTAQLADHGYRLEASGE